MGTTTTTTPAVLHLIADQWVNYGDEVYVNVFRNVLTPDQVNAHRRVSVYLESDDQEIPLGNNPVMFQGHQMWCTIVATDITLSYRCYDEYIPFRSVNIKIVID